MLIFKQIAIQERNTDIILHFLSPISSKILNIADPKQHTFSFFKRLKTTFWQPALLLSSAG